MKVARAVLLASLFVVSIACGGNLNRLDGGTAGGGAAGTGGSQDGTLGTGGTSGTGGAPVGPPPSCVLDLIASCPLTGSCQDELSDGGQMEKWCFDNGATVSETTSGNCSGTTGQTTIVQEARRADGTLCYSIEDTCYCGMFCEEHTLTWKNGAGTVVATGTFELGFTSTVTCAATGESCSGTANGSPDPGSCTATAVRYPAAAKGCTLGTCP
ncbi:MAG TPA: hypothetical protein VKQ32_16915 [Polyangia bacterium]|nr:hypothetical protein [Polyangia bacterium]